MSAPTVATGGNPDMTRAAYSVVNALNRPTSVKGCSRRFDRRLAASDVLRSTDLLGDYPGWKTSSLGAVRYQPSGDVSAGNERRPAVNRLVAVP